MGGASRAVPGRGGAGRRALTLARWPSRRTAGSAVVSRCLDSPCRPRRLARAQRHRGKPQVTTRQRAIVRTNRHGRLSRGKGALRRGNETDYAAKVLSRPATAPTRSLREPSVGKTQLLRSNPPLKATVPKIQTLHQAPLEASFSHRRRVGIADNHACPHGFARERLTFLGRRHRDGLRGELLVKVPGVRLRRHLRLERRKRLRREDGVNDPASARAFDGGARAAAPFCRTRAASPRRKRRRAS